jgi:hypothetical protein
VFVGLSLLACGGKSIDGPDAPYTGTNRGGSTAAGSDSGRSGSTSQGGTSLGGEPNGGAAGVAQCDATDYEDAMGGSVPVLIINDTPKTIHIGQETAGCVNDPTFQVADSFGRTVEAPHLCESSCHMLLAKMVIGCPPLPCIFGGVTTLQPGESMSSQWSALYREERKLPAACQAKAGVETCTRIADVTPGTYYFSARAGSGVRCDNMGPDGVASCGSCMPTGTGGCMTYGAVITPPLLEAKVEVQLDGSYGIGGPGGGGAARAVVITFKD